MVAWCLDGEAVIGGGCTWGATPGALFPTETAPTSSEATGLDGWACAGASNGEEVETLHATAMCLR